MSAPILVTGATGNIGREVVRLLVAGGVPVRAAVTSPDRARGALGEGAELVPFDFHDPATFAPAVRGARGLFLLRPPAIAKVRDTLNALVDVAAREGVGRVVFISVAGADKNPLIPHYAVERHLQSGAIPWTLLRPGFFAQNFGDAYRDDIRDDGRIFVPAGDGRVAFVDVRDVAEVAVLAFDDATRTRHAYTLTGPDAVTFDEAAKLLGDALGRPIRYARPSIPAYLRHLHGRGMGWSQAAVLTVLHAGLRLGQAEAVDPTLERLLGRRPRSLRDYLLDHLQLWR